MDSQEEKLIKFDGNSFIFSGRRVFIYSGEMHYFRIPQGQWYDRLLKAKRAFINSIGVYMAWNWHEQEKGVFCFKESRDLERWIQLASSLGLYIIARPGPYICAEWDFGGFPNWLLAEDCQMRSLESNFIKYCGKWLNKINTMIVPHLITNGGKIFIYQVENEYRVGNIPYHMKLKEIAVTDGVNVPFVTNSNPRIRGSEIIEMPDPYLRSWDISMPMKEIEDLRKTQNDKPPFGMEVGCLQYCEFGKLLPFSDGFAPPERDELYLKSLIAAGISGFNYYMYHGGTNPGYWTGRNITTTYDFDAPIKEWGELNERYYISRRLGGFLECLGEKLLETVPVENYCKVSNNEAKVFTRKHRDMLFIFAANLYAKDISFKISLKHASGQQLVIPRCGEYSLTEYSMNILPVNITLSYNIKLFYTTSQIFYFLSNDEENILILYEKPGFKGETVLELRDRNVKIFGRIKYEWIEKGMLYFYYVHTEEPEYIMIKGESTFRIILTLLI